MSRQSGRQKFRQVIFRLMVDVPQLVRPVWGAAVENDALRPSYGFSPFHMRRQGDEYQIYFVLIVNRPGSG
jgi:hypothetical protein